MKKILTVILTIFLTVNAFAQKKSYSELMAQGQKYEQEKKYIFAMASYIDAMNAENSDYAAKSSYSWIAEKIQSGAPGFDEYKDDFDLYEGWIKLAEEYETFWSNEPNKTYFISKPIAGKMNYEKNTVDYYIFLQWVPSEKFKKIYFPVMEGYLKASKRDWKNLPSDWLKKPRKAAPCLYGNMFDHDYILREGNFSMKEHFYMFDPIFEGDSSWCTYPPSSCFEIEILSKDGTVLYELVLDDFENVIKNVSRENYKKFEAGDYIIKVKNFYMCSTNAKCEPFLYNYSGQPTYSDYTIVDRNNGVKIDLNRVKYEIGKTSYFPLGERAEIQKMYKKLGME